MESLINKTLREQSEEIKSLKQQLEKERERKMPNELTAENGAKALLIGEFSQCFDPDDSGNPYLVSIEWYIIKEIYKKIVDYYSTQNQSNGKTNNK